MKLSKEGYEVHAISVNTGGFESKEVEEMKTKALQMGAHTYQYINALVQENPISAAQQSRINNFFAEEGLELTANDLTFFRPGQRHGVFIERKDVLGTVGFHSAGLLVDSLSVYSLFALVDENLAPGQVCAISHRIAYPAPTPPWG